MASVLCCIAGFVTLLLLPVLAKNTYISENALMPGTFSLHSFFFTCAMSLSVSSMFGCSGLIGRFEYDIAVSLSFYCMLIIHAWYMF